MDSEKRLEELLEQDYVHFKYVTKSLYDLYAREYLTNREAILFDNFEDLLDDKIISNCDFW
jgi:hypothetical protein